MEKYLSNILLSNEAKLSGKDYKFSQEVFNAYWIIIDNSYWCPEILRNIDEELSWQRVDFYGFGPINTYTWVTSIYLNPNKIINRKNYQLSSIGGIKNNDIFAS